MAIFQAADCDASYADLEYVAKDDAANVIRLWKSGTYARDKLKKRLDAASSDLLYETRFVPKAWAL